MKDDVSQKSLNDTKLLASDEGTRKKYFLMLRHQPEFKRRKESREYWKDSFGKEYNFGKNVRNFEKISSGTNTVWYYTDKDDLYLWGYGEVDAVAELPNNQFVARYKYFHLFSINSSAIKASPYLQKKIRSLQSWNPYNSIVVINEEIYKNLILFDNDKLPDKAFGSLFTALRTRTLKIPSNKSDEVYTDLHIPDDYRIICTLNTADKHFLFRLSDALKSRYGLCFGISKKSRENI